MATKKALLQELRDCEIKHGKVTEVLLRNDDEYTNPYYVKKKFGTLSEAKLQADLDDHGQIHLTDTEYKKINKTIKNDKYTREILTGLLMGDGWIGEDPGKDGFNFTIEMITKEFLEWVSEQLGDVVSTIRLKATAEELAEKNEKYGYTVNESNYNDIYSLRSRRVPALGEFRDWYSTGEKVFPSDMELTPTIVKMWYCCDGTFNTKNNSAVIYLSNEVDRVEYLQNLFKDVGLNVKIGTQQAHFSVSETQKLLNYMGESPPGFEYKWGL